MQKIRLLSKNLINRIAAGEVLERPSSAVKELVENSLDASSSKIDIFIRDGGKTEIKVLDNGLGMTQEDLKMSIMRHATSKFHNGIFSNINTYGFRGEALPAIGSVAKMHIASKTEQCENGFEINVDSGNVSVVKPIAKEKGTTITIKDIFFSTPARLKFLKSEKYENILIKKLVQKIAICNFNVAFKLHINERSILETTAKKYQDKMKNLKTRIVECLGSEFSENMKEFSHASEAYKVYGYLGIPTFNHSNRSNQYTFINGRIVSDKNLNNAIRYAYSDFLPYDRHAQVILFISVPNQDVDVNVHPAKSEVKFRDSDFLRKFISKSIKATLKEIGYESSSHNSRKLIKKFNSIHKLNFVNSNKYEETDLLDDQLYLAKKKNTFFNKDEKITDAVMQQPLGLAKCQLYKTYIISQTRNGFIIVDQHAAHERIVYENIKKNFYENKIKTQILLIPEIFKVDCLLIDILNNYKVNLNRLGIVIEKFGKNSVIVREIPAILSECNIRELVLDILDEIYEKSNNEILEERINKIFSIMSCHGSIRAGREMHTEEMNNLLREMESTPFSGQCNHGRPTFIKLGLSDI